MKVLKSEYKLCKYRCGTRRFSRLGLEFSEEFWVPDDGMEPFSEVSAAPLGIRFVLLVDFVPAVRESWFLDKGRSPWFFLEDVSPSGESFGDRCGPAGVAARGVTPVIGWESCPGATGGGGIGRGVPAREGGSGPGVVGEYV